MLNRDEERCAIFTEAGAAHFRTNWHAEEQIHKRPSGSTVQLSGEANQPFSVVCEFHCAFTSGFAGSPQTTNKDHFAIVAAWSISGGVSSTI